MRGPIDFRSLPLSFEINIQAEKGPCSHGSQVRNLDAARPVLPVSQHLEQQRHPEPIDDPEQASRSACLGQQQSQERLRRRPTASSNVQVNAAFAALPFEASCTVFAPMNGRVASQKPVMVPICRRQERGNPSRRPQEIPAGAVEMRTAPIAQQGGRRRRPRRHRASPPIAGYRKRSPSSMRLRATSAAPWIAALLSILDSPAEESGLASETRSTTAFP